MKLLRSINPTALYQKLSFAALILLAFSACKKQYDNAPQQTNAATEEAAFFSGLDITSSPTPRLYFMDGKDLFSVTHLDAAKPTVTKKWSIDTKYDEHFNNNINASSNTYAFNFKTNEIFSLDYNDDDNNLPYLFKNSVNVNSVTETKTTLPVIGGGLNHVRINPADGKVYYVAGGSISKMDANGANNQVVVQKLGINVLEMDIDFSKQLFYYVQVGTKSTLNVCGVNAQNNKEILSGGLLSGDENLIGSQVRLDLKKDKIYFSSKSKKQKLVRIWSISTSGNIQTLKKEFQLPYTDTWSGKLTFDVIPSLNKIVWCLHQRLPNGRDGLLHDVSVMGSLNVAKASSDIIYEGSNVNSIVAVNP